MGYSRSKLTPASKLFSRLSMNYSDVTGLHQGLSKSDPIRLDRLALACRLQSARFSSCNHRRRPVVGPSPDKLIRLEAQENDCGRRVPGWKYRTDGDARWMQRRWRNLVSLGPRVARPVLWFRGLSPPQRVTGCHGSSPPAVSGRLRCHGVHSRAPANSSERRREQGRALPVHRRRLRTQGGADDDRSPTELGR